VGATQIPPGLPRVYRQGTGMNDENPGQVPLTQVIADQVKELSGDRAMPIAELTETGIVMWKVRRDACGSPRARHWAPVPWSELSERGELSDRRLIGFIRRLDRSGLLVYTDRRSPTVRLAREMITTSTGGSPVFVPGGRFEELLGQVLAAEPITQWYELATLRQSAAGRLVFTGIPLFPPGARRGDRTSFSIRCEPGTEYGTVFAVTASESAGRARLLSVQSARLTAGRYDLTAELRRPGLVHFDGLPARLNPERRPWPVLVASVPAERHPLHPSHLICMVEISGTDAQVRDRLDRVDQLIKIAARGTEQRLSVSLVTYGPHPVHWNSTEEPVRVLTWARSGAEALEQLWRLEGRPVAIGYPRAAQLECALTKIAERLTGEDGRPVVVTVGARPPFPARVDPVTEIIPCPAKNDWRRALHLLMEHPGVAFGAVTDRDPDGVTWTRLGTDAAAQVRAFDARRFAARLGLLSPNIPFPLAGPDADGGAGRPGAAATHAEKDGTTRFVEAVTGIGSASFAGDGPDPDGPGVSGLESELFVPGQGSPSASDALAYLRSGTGEIRIPPPPRLLLSDVLVSVYLSNAVLHQRVEAAVDEVLNRVGLEIYRHEDPLTAARSWYRRMIAGPLAGSGRPAGRPGAGPPGADPSREATARRLMANLGWLLTGLSAERNAVVRLGPVLVVKDNEPLSIVQLTLRQEHLLHVRPELTAAPAEILMALGRLPSEGMDGAEPPFGDGD
jgi:hypothetical protein